PYEFMDSSNREQVRQLSRRRQREGSLLAEVLYKRKDGSDFCGLMSSSNLYDDKGQQIGAISFITDITERKKAEQALREQAQHIEAMNQQLQQQLEENIHAKQALAENEAALAILINNVNESIFSVDKEMRLISFNTVFADRSARRYGIAPQKG